MNICNILFPFILIVLLLLLCNQIRARGGMYGDFDYSVNDIEIEQLVNPPAVVKPIDPADKMPPLPKHSSGVGITYNTQRQPNVIDTNIIRIYGLGELSKYNREIYVPKNLPWLQYGKYIKAELGLKDIPTVTDEEGFDIESRALYIYHVEAPKLLYII